MNARSALFDVYGDHLRTRGGEAPVAALVRILAPLDIAAPAVRTAISRMVRQHWLTAVKLESGPGYRLTPRAERRLSDAAARDRVRTGLGYLGYAPLRDDTWISPRASSEVDALLTQEGVRARRFWAQHDGDDAALAAQAWDLDGLGRAYSRWLVEAHELVDQPSGAEVADPDQDDFVVRSRLVHEWRKFLFRDPGLPRELLPPGWSGAQAAAFFDREAERLLPGAERYVDACLRSNGGPR